MGDYPPILTEEQLKSSEPGLSGADRIGSTPIEGVDNPDGTPAATLREQIAAIAARAVALLAKPNRSGLLKASRDVADPVALEASEKGSANGVAELDAGGLILPQRLPALAIDRVFSGVGSAAAMTALDAQRGDVAIRTDFQPNRMHMLAEEPATVAANWTRVTFGDVVSVNGQTGVVTISPATVSQDGLMSAADKQKLDSVAQGGGSPDATTTVKGLVELGTLSEARDGTAGILVATVATMKALLDERSLARRDHFAGNGPQVLTGANAATNNSFTSADLRGVGGIPLNARGIYVMVYQPAAGSGRYGFLDSADAPNASPASPRFFNNAAQVATQLAVPLGAAGGPNAGKIKLSAGANPINSVDAYANGWWI